MQRPSAFIAASLHRLIKSSRFEFILLIIDLELQFGMYKTCVVINRQEDESWRFATTRFYTHISVIYLRWPIMRSSVMQMCRAFVATSLVCLIKSSWFWVHTTEYISRTTIWGAQNTVVINRQELAFWRFATTLFCIRISVIYLRWPIMRSSVMQMCRAFVATSLVCVIESSRFWVPYYWK